jgi:hypothetical protein
MELGTFIPSLPPRCHFTRGTQGNAVGASAALGLQYGIAPDFPHVASVARSRRAFPLSRRRRDLFERCRCPRAIHPARLLGNQERSKRAK